MSISISIHVDGYYGLKKGVDNLLKLFDKYNIKASFFVNMGKEANILELLKYRSKRLKKGDKGIAKRYSKSQLIKMALLSRKLGHGNCKILRKIISKGHEVNPHSWSHLKWSKNFEEMNYEKEIEMMKQSFFRCTEKKPKGFIPPTWKINDDVLEVLKKEGFEYVGINKGKKQKRKGILLIPLSFPKNIEELLNEGKKREEIVTIYKKELKKEYVNLYFHADFEGIRGIRLFEEVLKLINPEKVITYEEILRKSK